MTKDEGGRVSKSGQRTSSSKREHPVGVEQESGLLFSRCSPVCRIDPRDGRTVRAQVHCTPCLPAACLMCVSWCVCVSRLALVSSQDQRPAPCPPPHRASAAAPPDHRPPATPFAQSRVHSSCLSLPCSTVYSHSRLAASVIQQLLTHVMSSMNFVIGMTVVMAVLKTGESK